MKKHHLIISGTGRAGTTFLIQLLTELGLDTGFHDLESCVFDHCHAGMEWDICHPQAPYIIKSPNLCDHLDCILENTNIQIDHAIVPVRDLFSAAQSRVYVEFSSGLGKLPGQHIPGGLWDTDIADFQEPILAIKLYHLIYTLAKWEIPLTLLSFPRIVHDSQYLFEKLQWMLGDMSWQQFNQVFVQVVQPNLVHNFCAETAEDFNLMALSA